MLRIVESSAERAKCKLPARKPQIEPTAPSPLLSRLSAFIPQLQAANQHLQSTPPAAARAGLDIEVIPQAAQPSSSDESTSEADIMEAPEAQPDQPFKPHIEMDIACGVLDLNNAGACQAAEAAAAKGPSLDEDLAAAEPATVSQRGLRLPGGDVMSPVAGSPRESSPKQDAEQADILEVSTTRFTSAKRPGREEVSNEGVAGAAPSENAGAPDGEAAVAKRPKITML